MISRSDSSSTQTLDLVRASCVQDRVIELPIYIGCGLIACHIHHWLMSTLVPLGILGGRQIKKVLWASRRLGPSIVVKDQQTAAVSASWSNLPTDGCSWSSTAVLIRIYLIWNLLWALDHLTCFRFHRLLQLFYIIFGKSKAILPWPAYRFVMWCSSNSWRILILLDWRLLRQRKHHTLFLFHFIDFL
jgi:hypothetical protein